MSLKCPCCKEGFIETREKNFFCEHYTPDGEPQECNFILWRTDLQKFGRGPLTEDEAIRLIRGERIPLKKLTSKSGKKFDCEGELSELDCSDGKKRWQVKFIFPETQRRVLGE